MCQESQKAQGLRVGKHGSLRGSRRPYVLVRFAGKLFASMLTRSELQIQYVTARDTTFGLL